MDKEKLQVISEIILPPGSTSVDLQAAIDGATSGDVIIISGDMPFTNAVTIPMGKDITIKSDESNNWVMSSPGTNTRHYGVNGNLIFQNITLDGGEAGGGVAVNNGGSLTMGNGSIVQNCTMGYGGGIVVRTGGRFTMNGTSIVRNCTAASYGGGVYLNGGSFDMGDNTAIDNCSIPTGNDRYGGGVYVSNSSSFIMNGKAVIQNCVANHGGGVYVSDSGFTMSGDAVIQNCAAAFYTQNSMGGGICISNNGSFTMNGGAIVKDCTSVFRGGGICIQDSTNITINGESMINNCTAPFGGGIQSAHSSFTISGGVVIQNCKADDYGGGIRLANSMLIMKGSAEIKDCTAVTRGGGLFLNVSSTLIMSDDTAIKDCKSDNNGGGIYLMQNSRVEMTGGGISNNHANNDGGGVYVLEGTLEIKSVGYIVDNNAINGNGGGIFTADTTYVNLSIADNTVFSRNKASIAYDPPLNASVLYPNIQFASVSITDHPLNNFDINYIGSNPVKLNVSYNANGGIGSYKGPDISPGETDTVLSPQETAISRAGYTFVIWNTQPDGSGIPYAPGDAIILDINTVLFAQWAAEPKTYTVTYNCNGGSGQYVDHCREFEVSYMVLSTGQTGISRTNFLFASWNTQPDASGTSYASGKVITVSSDLVLYAQWRQIPEQKRLCRAPTTISRKAIEGQKLWVDNDNAGDTRPPSVEIILLRDGEVYRRVNIDSSGDGYFGFCCLPVWKNSLQKFNYQIDETEVPGYTKTIEGYNVINTFTP